MASQSVARSESIAAFIPELERLIAEVIDELERFRVEFHLGPDGEVDELIFHQPNGTFVAPRA